MLQTGSSLSVHDVTVIQAVCIRERNVKNKCEHEEYTGDVLPKRRQTKEKIKAGNVF